MLITSDVKLMQQLSLITCKHITYTMGRNHIPKQVESRFRFNFYQGRSTLNKNILHNLHSRATQSHPPL